MPEATMFETKTDYRKFNKQTLGIDDIVPKPVVLPKSPETKEGSLLIEKAFRYWNSLADFRTRRKRARNYMRGRQWEDKVCVNGKWITEGDYMRSMGRSPLVNNQMQQIRKNVKGQWRGNESKPIVQCRDRKDARAEEMMSNALFKVYDINNITELDAAGYDEFILSGMVVGRSAYEYMKERNHNEVFTKNPNVNRMFMNTDIEDIRMLDLDFLGQFMDLSLDQLIAAFAKTEADQKWIEDIYCTRNVDTNPGSHGFTAQRTDNLSFLTPSDNSKCRVFEIWQLDLFAVLHCHDELTGKKTSTRKKAKDIDNVNRQRIAEAQLQGVPADQVPIVKYEKAFEQIWEVFYLSPWGHILYHSETPYTHESHPFTVFAYPLIDGEVWGLYEDVIDQQRYVNRMIMLYDFIISASAKGVLLVNENNLSDDFDLDAVASEWTKFNGVIKLKLKTGESMSQAAQQISANSTNIGLQEMIALQMRLLQDIAGVNGAAQGQAPTAGTSGTLYNQQAQNSAVNLRDSFEAYQRNFKRPRDMKLLKLIGQYYNESRNISGSTTSDKFPGTDFFDPQVIKDLEFDLVISQVNETPNYRELVEGSLKELFAAGQISIRTYLENSSLPMADKLLDSITKEQEAAQAQQMSPEMIAQGQKANPQAIGMFDQMMKGGQQRAA